MGREYNEKMFPIHTSIILIGVCVPLHSGLAWFVVDRSLKTMQMGMNTLPK
jgi:hypothetical protein